MANRHVSADSCGTIAAMSLRRTGGTPKKVDAFFDAMAQGLSVSSACKASGLARRTAYRMRQQDEEFSLRWADAHEDGNDAFQDEARRRAMEGVLQADGVRKYSDNLLMFVMKKRMPEYRDTVQVNSTVTHRNEPLRRAAERDPALFEQLARLMKESEAS